MHAFGLKLLFNENRTLGWREGYDDDKAQSEPTIHREHEERKHQTFCDEIDLANN